MKLVILYLIILYFTLWIISKYLFKTDKKDKDIDIYDDEY